MKQQKKNEKDATALLAVEVDPLLSIIFNPTSSMIYTHRRRNLPFLNGRSVLNVFQKTGPTRGCFAYPTEAETTRQHGAARERKVWVVQKLKTDQSLEKQKKKG